MKHDRAGMRFLAASVPPLGVHTAWGPNGSLRVVASGEIDLDTSASFRRVLAAALSSRRQVVELHLAGVSFCDCTGLSALLWAREHAARRGVRLRLGALSPCMTRLLALTGTDGLFERLPEGGASASQPPRCIQWHG